MASEGEDGGKMSLRIVFTLDLRRTKKRRLESRERAVAHSLSHPTNEIPSLRRRSTRPVAVGVVVVADDVLAPVFD